MSYSTSLKPFYCDPIYDASKKRTEFRLLDSTVYTSNLRLLNVGMNYGGSGVYTYNFTAGAYAVIDRIQLLSGNELLEEVRDFGKWITFQNYNNSNDMNKSLNKFVNKSNFGFELVDGLDQAKEIKYSPYYSPKVAFVKSDNDTETQLGWLNLRSVFSFLKNVQYLDTDKLKKLRVVVYYNTRSVYFDNTNTDLQAADSTAEPLLVADEVLEGGSMPDVVEYMPVEIDRVIVPGEDSPATLGTEQEKKIRINGFNNKRVQRLLMVNSGTTNSLLDVTRFGSQAQVNQKVQVAVNGVNKLPFDGQEGANRRLALLHDTWGECNTIDALAHAGCGSCVNVYTASNVLNYHIGSLDYFGMSINEKVEDLQLTYTRTNVADSGIVTDQKLNQVNEQLELTLFAEVPKVAQLKGGVVLTSYLE